MAMLYLDFYFLCFFFLEKEQTKPTNQKPSSFTGKSLLGKHQMQMQAQTSSHLHVTYVLLQDGIGGFELVLGK